MADTSLPNAYDNPNGGSSRFTGGDGTGGSGAAAGTTMAVPATRGAIGAKAGSRIGGAIVGSLCPAVAAGAFGIAGLLYSPNIGDSTLTGARARLQADLTKRWKPEKGQLIYRVWDGITAPSYGRYWTPINPMMMQAFGLSPRRLLGLPNENTW